MRTIAPPVTDKRYFRNTAVKTKSVNLPTFIKRGGLRF